MADLLTSTVNQLRVAKRLAPRRGASLHERVGPLDDRFVFVVGSPRSGTTFLADVIGSVPGFIDLGEVAVLKSAVPELVAATPDEAARRLRRILAVARRVGLVGDVRPVEQTPEMAHLLHVARRVYPEARFVHIVRDGRDVVCSLLDKKWLQQADGRDDAGIRYGTYARFWVEPQRRVEFVEVSDARRAAWAWRRYVTAARAADDSLEVRYEQLVSERATVVAALADHLGVELQPLEDALGVAHTGSVGRWQRDLSAGQLEDVIAESGDLLRELGYVT